MYAYSQIEHEYETMNDLIEKEMYNAKSQALQRLPFIAAHFKKEILSVLAYGYFDSQPDSIKLADKLNLGKLDFLAIQEDFEGFKEEYLKN